jgi:hypothetical protein
MDTDIIEGYLVRSGIPYDAIGEGMWVVHDEIDQVDNIVVTLSHPVVMFRVKLMDLPTGEAERSAVCRKLLELNASSMVAGAYALEGDAVVAVETLQSENLDFNEFQAAIDGLTLAITEHYESLREYHHLGSAEA